MWHASLLLVLLLLLPHLAKQLLPARTTDIYLSFVLETLTLGICIIGNNIVLCRSLTVNATAAMCSYTTEGCVAIVVPFPFARTCCQLSPVPPSLS